MSHYADLHDADAETIRKRNTELNFAYWAQIAAEQRMAELVRRTTAAAKAYNIELERRMRS